MSQRGNHSWLVLLCFTLLLALQSPVASTWAQSTGNSTQTPSTGTNFNFEVGAVAAFVLMLLGLCVGLLLLVRLTRQRGTA